MSTNRNQRIESLLLSLIECETEIKFLKERNKALKLLEKLRDLCQSVEIFYNDFLTESILVIPMHMIEQASEVNQLFAENLVEALKNLQKETQAYLDPVNEELLVRKAELEDLLSTAKANINRIINFVDQYTGLIDGWIMCFEIKTRLFHIQYSWIISKLFEL